MLWVRHTVRKTVLRALCGAVCVLCQHAAEKLHASGLLGVRHCDWFPAPGQWPSLQSAAVRDRARAVTERQSGLGGRPIAISQAARVRYLAPLYPQLFPQHPGPSHQHQPLALGPWCPGRQAL